MVQKTRGSHEHTSHLTPGYNHERLILVCACESVMACRKEINLDIYGDGQRSREAEMSYSVCQACEHTH